MTVRTRLCSAARGKRAPFDRVSYEVIPTVSVEQAVHDHVPRHLTVTVTASPTKGLEPTLALTESLARAGYRVVPHLSARLVADAGELAEIVCRLVEAGVHDVFVPAGDADRPVGSFESSLPVLQALAATRPFARVGITGYPERHPRIGDDVTIQAMWDKRRYGDYIVSNLCLDPAMLRSWIGRIRRRGIELPLEIGLAGPVDRARLLAVAAKIGVGESTRFLSRHLGAIARMGVPGGYDPARFLARIGPVLTAPESRVEGLHVFTFNQLSETEAWRRDMLERLEISSSPPS